MPKFFDSLPSFSSFEQFTREAMYHPLPDDWVVVVADIKNSTSAIDAGKYKEVNLIGAACITQTMQSQHTQNIPFVFGGDGASICVHKDDAIYVGKRLAKLQALAQSNFDLELRVAIIPIREIRQHAVDVCVAKLEITEGKYIALFRGGGLAVADTLAKDDEKYAIDIKEENLDSLEGLSCRWSPVPSRKGVVVSLLVMARDAQAMSVYETLLERFRSILGRDIADTNPVQENLVKYKSVVEAIRDEASYHQSWFSKSFLVRLLDILLAVLIFKHGINPLGRLFDAVSYKDSISHHSDFRKFDDMLRLIMDCSQDEFDELQSLLEQGFRDGHLYYGLHTSGDALMTCFVETTQQGGHLHFIDGGNGGLAIAARQMKEQMAVKA